MFFAVSSVPIDCHLFCYVHSIEHQIKSLNPGPENRQQRMLGEPMSSCLLRALIY